MNKSMFLMLITIYTFGEIMEAQSKLPIDNLGYPVLINLENGSSGTGFFVNTNVSSFLLTAKHVLFDRNNQLLSKNGKFISNSKDNNEKEKNELSINLDSLIKNNLLLYDREYDFAIIKIGKYEIVDKRKLVKLSPGITLISATKEGIVGCNEKVIKKYDDVTVSNDVFILGYPLSLGIPDKIQFDPMTPLLRKGIVAGKYDKLKTIILDIPVYYGNSGGPVLEMVERPEGTYIKLIGIVTEFIPFISEGYNIKEEYKNYNVNNSGYSVCVSMDIVLETIKKME